jgi:hypothetical protein
MARKEIFIGSAGNDGTGDTLRSGGQKINDNFAELYQDVAAMQLLVADSAGGLNLEGITFDQRAVVFIGEDSANSVPADNNETYLKAQEPTKDNIITLPDSSGRLALLTDIGAAFDSQGVLDLIGTHLDSALTIQLINEHAIDSTGVIGLVDADYIKQRQDPAGLDSALTRQEIDLYLTKYYLTSNNLVLDSGDVNNMMLGADGNFVDGRIDSSMRNLRTNIVPNITGTRRLGSNTNRFTDLFLSDQIELDSANITYSSSSARLLLDNVRVLKLQDQGTGDSGGFLINKNSSGEATITINSHFSPLDDSTYDLGDSNLKWRELYLSGSTIHLGGVKIKAINNGSSIRVEDSAGTEINLGGGLTQSQVDGRIVAYGTITTDSAKDLDDSAFNRFVPAGNAGDLTIISGDGTNTLSTKTILEVSDKFFDDSADMEEGKLDRPTNQDIFNTWRKISHDTSGTFPANLSEANSWSYNSGTDTISSTVNSSTFIGFVSKDKFKDFDHEATLSSTAADDDLIGLLVGYDRPSVDSEYSLTVFRTGGGLLSSTYGLVYNAGQSDEAVLVDGKSTITVSGANNNWNTTGQTKVLAEKRGKDLTFTTSQQPSTTLDTGTELTFDLSSDSRTQRFVGKTRYGYVARSQDAATFSNNTFTPTTPVKLIHFNGTETDNFGGDVYTYDASNTQWGVDSDISLADDPGRFFHNDMTGRTYYVGQGEDGFAGYAVGSVRQFNDVLYLKPMDAEPDSASTGGLGKRAGQIAHADGVNFNPDSRSAGKPYLVFYNGYDWIPMTDSV